MKDEMKNSFETELIKNDELSGLIRKIETENYQQALYAKKQYQMSSVSAFCSIAVLAVTIVSALVLVPKALTLMNQLENVLNAELPEMMKNLNTLIENTDRGLSDTFNQVSQIDFESLNNAIVGLQKTLEPLSRLFGGK